MDYTHKLSLTDYLVNSDPDFIGDHAKEYHLWYKNSKIVYAMYGGQKPPAIECCWMFRAYLHTVNSSALYEEVIEKAPDVLDPTNCLEFIIQAECPFLIHRIEDGCTWCNYDPENENPIWASLSEESDICTPVQMSDSIFAIATRLRIAIERAGVDAVNPSLDPFDEQWLYATYQDTEVAAYNRMLDNNHISSCDY